MLFGNRGPRSLAARRRGEFQPKFQALEERCLLSIDIGGVAPPGLPNVATIPYGVDLGGALPGGAAGFSVTDVGDVNGDGFDDFVVGAPTGVNIGGQVQPGVGTNSRAYLIFGSLSVTSANVPDWLALDKLGQRVGDLGQLNNATQTDPITGLTGYNYSGLTFLTSAVGGSQLGASVTALGDINGDGKADFMIGAPNHVDANGLNPGTGRAYLVFGGTALTTVTGNTFDFDNPAAGAGVNVITFVSTIPNSHVGRALAGLGNFLSTGSAASDIAIGAPDASLAGKVDNGAVYVVPGSLVAGAGTGTINLQTIGQGGAGGVVFAGTNSADEIGLAVAGAGDVDGAITVAFVPIDDLLIGAPNMNGLSGNAYLVYGGNTVAGLATTVGGTNVILANRIGGTGTTGVSGAVFQGVGGERAGFAVAGIGDYNSDGFSDIAIGSPFFTGANTGLLSGRVNVFYGQPTIGTTLTGTIPLSTIPAGVPSMTLVGAAGGALAGYSLSLSGKINPLETGNDFLIGSPGLNADQGGVYYVPANPFFLTGTFQLAAAESQPLAATLIQITNTPGNTPAFLGASVSGRLVVRGAAIPKTADLDGLADFIIGAPGYGVTTGRTLDGGVFVIEGAFLPIQTPINTAIQTQIGVGAPFGPFVVNATTPNALNIFVFSNNTTTPPFNPVTDIDPTTVVVNGVPFPNATIAADPVDENLDGIPDAIITITPRSRINLLNTTTTFTITGRTKVNSLSGGKAFSGSTGITVTGGANGGGGGVITGGINAGLPVGEIVPTSFLPQFGPDQFVPPITALSRLDYKAIPFSVAYQQYLPGRGWAARLQNFAHPEALSRVSGKQHSLRGTLSSSLPHSVFTRSKFHGNQPVEFRHARPVIPTNRQTERFLGKPGAHRKHS